MTSGFFNRKLGFALLVIFYGFYHGKSPFFTTIWDSFLENFFPSILGKFKEMKPSLLFGAFFFELSCFMQQFDKRSFETNGWIKHQLGFLRFEEF